jgi:hypothetical protein
VRTRHISLAPSHVYAPKGERFVFLTSFGVEEERGKNTTLLSSMTVEGMATFLAMEGAATAVVFEAYVERVLAPSIRRCHVVIMDNLGHTGPRG